MIVSWRAVVILSSIKKVTLVLGHPPTSKQQYISLHVPKLLTGLVAQWSSALAAMAMLPASTWVQVPPTTSGVFLL